VETIDELFARWMQIPCICDFRRKHSWNNEYSPIRFGPKCESCILADQLRERVASGESLAA
jgi:alpha-glucosidase (family GH31 glycosyl hydrolase)